MRKVIRFPMCSFCGKGKRNAGRIIAGEKVCICDECVEILAGKGYILPPDTRTPEATEKGEK